VIELYDDFVTMKELKKYNSKSRSRKIREMYIIEQAPTQFFETEELLADEHLRTCIAHINLL
jgi:hypothetical protein